MTETTVEPAPRTLTTFVDSLGVRARRRAEPRTTTSVAGAGCVLAVAGALLVGIDAGVGRGGFSRWPGLVLAVLVTLAGSVAMRTAARGPIATAGCVAVLLGIPAVVAFLTLSTGRFPPFSATSFLVLTTAGWVAAYLVGPGRGRTVYLGAALLGGWLAVIQLTEQPLDFFPMGFLFLAIERSSGDAGVPFLGPAVPDLFVIGLLSLAIGTAYALAARWCDGRGYRGMGTAFALATIPAVQVGVLAMGDDLGTELTGLVVAVAGGALAHQGATLGRRATSWIGGAMVLAGAASIVLDSAQGSTSAGLALLVLGGLTVWASHLVHVALGEPADTQLTSGTRPFRRPRPS